MQRLKEEAHRSGMPLKQVVNTTLEIGLRNLHKAPKQQKYRLKAYPMGTPQNSDLDKALQIATPTERHWSILRQFISDFGTASNLTTDAHIAALAVEKGGVLYSCDHDFSRFSGLKWINPLPVST